MDGLKRYVNDDRFRVDGDKNMRLLAFAFTIVFEWTGPKKFLEVSRCSRAKQRQRNVQKKCSARAKLLFCLLDLLLFFTVLRRCLRRLALHDFIFCLNKL